MAGRTERGTNAGEWYTSRDLLEMIGGLKEDIHGLRVELRTTQESVRKYNGLREDLAALSVRVITLETGRMERSNVSRAIREWGGWIVAVLGLMLTWIFGT